MKVCRLCNTEKPYTEFSPAPTTKDRYCNRCKVCMNTISRERFSKLENKTKAREYYNQNKERIINYANNYRNVKKDGTYYVYHLPNATDNSPLGYVGCTNWVKQRISEHRYVGRDTTGYTILGKFLHLDDALQLETSYHDSGYAGRHANNLYVKR